MARITYQECSEDFKERVDIGLPSCLLTKDQTRITTALFYYHFYDKFIQF